MKKGESYMDKNINEKKELFSLIEAELENIDKLVIEMKEYKEFNTKLYRRSKGSILHDFYNACERVFEKIVRRINGGIREEKSWHKKVSYQMTIEIEDIRPAVISEKLAADLDEYLAFRHLFRNIYGFELLGERLDRLVDKFETVVKLFKNEIRSFLKKL